MDFDEIVANWKKTEELESSTKNSEAVVEVHQSDIESIFEIEDVKCSPPSPGLMLGSPFDISELDEATFLDAVDDWQPTPAHLRTEITLVATEMARCPTASEATLPSSHLDDYKSCHRDFTIVEQNWFSFP